MSIFGVTSQSRVCSKANHGIKSFDACRDEIYCGLCRQLRDNVYKESTKKGWLLMNIVANCFPPSERVCLTVLRFQLNLIYARLNTSFATFDSTTSDFLSCTARLSVFETKPWCDKFACRKGEMNAVHVSQYSSSDFCSAYQQLCSSSIRDQRSTAPRPKRLC